MKDTNLSKLIQYQSIRYPLQGVETIELNTKKIKKWNVFTIPIASLLSQNAFAEQKIIDRVSVIVDQGIVLESEIEPDQSCQKVSASQRSAITSTEPPNTGHRKTHYDSLQMQRATQMGIQISDIQLDQTIANIARDEGKTLNNYATKLKVRVKTFNSTEKTSKPSLWPAK